MAPFSNFVSLLGLTVGLAACPAPESTSAPKPAPTKGPPNWKQGFQYKVRHDAKAQSLIVDLKLAPGFHAYTTGETIGKPVAVELTPQSAKVLAAPVAYPKGQTKDLPLGRSVILEGEEQIRAGLKPNPDASASSKILGTFHYQICTDEACDRPRKEKFEVSAAE